MRLHRLQLQGLRSPRGSHEFLFRAGYNVVLSADPEQRRDFSRLLHGLLYPEELGALAAWSAPEASEGAQAVLEFEAKGQAYRVLVDFSADRVGLIRAGPERGGHALLASGLPAVGAQLDSLGRPPAALFRALCGLHLEAPRAEAADVARDPAASEDPELTEARVRIGALLSERAEVSAALEERADVAAAVVDDDLAPRLRRFHELSTERRAERVALAAKHQELREAREHLAAGRSTFLRWGGLAAAAGLAAAGVAWGIGAGDRPLLVTALALLSLALLWLRRARRQRVRIEARSAALVVREQMLARSLDFETGGLPRLLADLGLGSAEALETAVREVQELRERHDGIVQELEKTREALPDGGGRELDELELLLTASAVSGGASGSISVDSLPVVRAVAHWLERSEAEISELGVPRLEAYLADLGRGKLCDPSFGSGQWRLRVAPDTDPGPLSEVSDPTRSRFVLALRFALVEQFADRIRVPVLIGPEPPAGFDPGSWPEVCRALAHLSAGMQVVQVAPLQGPWVELAHAIHPL